MAHIALHKLAKKYGNVMTFWLGPNKLVLVSGKDELKVRTTPTTRNFQTFKERSGGEGELYNPISGNDAQPGVRRADPRLQK